MCFFTKGRKTKHAKYVRLERVETASQKQIGQFLFPFFIKSWNFSLGCQRWSKNYIFLYSLLFSLTQSVKHLNGWVLLWPYTPLILVLEQYLELLRSCLHFELIFESALGSTRPSNNMYPKAESYHNYKLGN